MRPTPEQVAAGHAFYTPRALKLYDAAILGYFSRLAWRCPAARILAHYDRHVSANHLDVGVGTGWFLDRCDFGTATPRLALMDPNRACLVEAGRRTARYEPEVHQADVLEPIAIDGPAFDSIGLTYLLHCLPGTIEDKGVVFEHLKGVAAPGAVVFGATLLHDGVPRNPLARTVMRHNNARGIFSNADDSLDGLRSVLDVHLRDPECTVVGCVGVFAGRA